MSIPMQRFQDCLKLCLRNLEASYDTISSSIKFVRPHHNTVLSAGIPEKILD